MKKARLLPLLLAILMMASLAFAEQTNDPAVVKAGDNAIGLSEAQEMFDFYYQQYAELYAQNGLVFDSAEAASLRDAIVELLAQYAIMDGKVAEYGLGEITDADKEALRKEVDENFEADLVAYAAQVGLDVEAARASVAEQGITPDSIYESNLSELPYNRLREYVVKDVTVADEDVEKEYESYVEEDKTAYENDIASYEMYSSYYGSGEIFYVPEGFRYVKHILLAMPDDVSAEMMDYETDMNASQTKLDTLTDELYALENTDENAETEPRTADEIQADIDAEQKVFDELQAKYDEAREQILPSLKPMIDEINSKLEAGTSFDDLIAEYNTDPGMESNPEGYKVHKDSMMWETNFRDAAMALANIGDVSEPVLSDFGVHIIQYTGDVEGGAVPLTDEVAEMLRTSLLSYKQDEAYQAEFAKWMEAVEIETHPELIVMPEIEDAPEAEEEPAAEAAGESAEETEAPVEENKDGSVG